MNCKEFGSGCGLIKVLSSIFLKGLRKVMKTSVRIVGIPAEIQTGHFLITGLENCLLSQLAP
jgi:hypothetical protein